MSVKNGREQLLFGKIQYVLYCSSIFFICKLLLLIINIKQYGNYETTIRNCSIKEILILHYSIL